MIKKIIAFQKMMFNAALFTKGSLMQNNKIKKQLAELVIFIMCTFIGYYMENKLFNGLTVLTSIFPFFLCALYTFLHERDNFLFTLPLKRNFIISNIYIFSTNLVIIFIFFIPIFFIIIPSIDYIFSHQSFYLNAFDISCIETIIILFSIKLTYINGMTTIFFIKKSKLRSVFYIIFTALYSSILLYFNRILTYNLNKTSNDITRSLMMIPNSWIYIIISICTAIAVTILGTFISIKLDKMQVHIINR
ncbi:MAG: ABC-2 transporter permease [Bacillota bacterium]|nr:ABC-2 transporter permease [Bacillota bacterium]